jgi:hypothetical protein
MYDRVEDIGLVWFDSQRICLAHPASQAIDLGRLRATMECLAGIYRGGYNPFRHEG